jgi:NDP-sugar pyrophosphorylase family protein
MAYTRLPNAPELVVATNGDIITNVRLSAMVAAHSARAYLATIMLTPFVSPYGLVDISDDDRVLAFREKPTLPYWINGGIYLLSKHAIELFPVAGDHETTTFPRLAEERRLGAFRSTDYWRAVDTVKDLSEVSRELERRLLTSFLA